MASPRCRLQVMKELPDGKGGTPALDHPLYKVLNRRPNKWMTAFELAWRQ